MGAAESKFQGPGQRLGTSNDPPANVVTRPPTHAQPVSRVPRQAPPVPVPARTQNGGEGDAAKREAAIAAAERRRQEEAKRGTVATNTNQGALSKELEKQKRDQNAKTAPPERVIWD